MKLELKKIHHLIRYFIVLAAITFVGYIKQLNDNIFLFLMGPILYLAHALKSFISSNITSLPSTDLVNDYFFILPICLIYFGLIGFQLKQLWNERGKIRFVILVVFAAFIIYIHLNASKALAVYLTQGPIT